MSEPTLDQRFAEAMGRLLGSEVPKNIALAVSGGGDSMAMLALAHDWARDRGPQLWVVTVDHGLRAESAAEAAMVAEFCATLGHPHATLRWRCDGAGNLQDAARRARLGLIDRWRGGIRHVLMAHTADDVAETFLIRLARGSGVEGLSAIEAKRNVPPHAGAGHAAPAPDEVSQAVEPPLPETPLPEPPLSESHAAGDPAVSAGFQIIRPCLGMTRAEFRQHVRTRNVPWVEDPSNDDPKYVRARARRLLATLDPLGMSAGDLVATAHRMRRASEALRARAASVADAIVREAGGTVIFDRPGLEQVERDTQLRLLAAACMWVSGAEYRPRAVSLEDLLERLLRGGSGTLIGARAQTVDDACHVFREFAAVARLRTPVVDLWDGRWRVAGPAAEGMEIRALGEAVADCPHWRETGLPRAALLASPAIWLGDDLVAAPLAGHDPRWTARIVTPFMNYLVSH